MYASKRRQRNFKRVRDPPKSLSSTNPSKRHRERLNGELETVAMLLPYDGGTISRLDKLSVLRLAVSFLQCKAHFQACIHNSAYLTYPSTHNYFYQPSIPTPFSNKVPTIFDFRMLQPMLDQEECNFEEISLKALGGFILVINDNGEIYYASENIENFLGFHQSDVLHQPIYDLIHSEDRDDIRQQLDVNFSVPTAASSSHQHVDVFQPQNSKFLERNVNARFRCLLDNTCGFLRIDMRGKLFSIHGLPSSYVMGRTNSGPVLGMICICTPFVPPSTSEMVSEDLILKTKHQLDGSLVSMDQRVYDMLEINDCDLPISLYSLIHAEDAICMAEAHKEAIKNGSSGILVYRLISRKMRRTYFVQSSCRIFYKNSKPESIGLTHRLLNEVEGTMLLEKRSSLKAKLLSFDDSFLQSPRNLQSTAALPLPSSVKEDSEMMVMGSSECLPSTSNAPIQAILIPKPSRRKKEQPTHHQEQHLLHPHPFPNLDVPFLDLQYHQQQLVQHPMLPWHDHPYYNHPGLMPPQVPYLGPPPPPQHFPEHEYHHNWHDATVVPTSSGGAPQQAFVEPKIYHPQIVGEFPADFPHQHPSATLVPKHTHPHHHHHDGFNLISEVTNLLGS